MRRLHEELAAQIRRDEKVAARAEIEQVLLEAIRFERRTVVEAQRDGYSPAQLADLAEELGAWATNNAREMGLKDAEAVGDFDFRSFSREIQPQNDIDSPPSSPKATAPVALKRRISLPKEPAASSPQSPSVIAHAQRHGTEKTAPVAHARRSSESSQQPDDDQADGLGLASMIRNDSLTNLVEYGTEEAPQQTQEAPDGAGLASMIRNDSLTNLVEYGTEEAPATTQEALPACSCWSACWA